MLAYGILSIVVKGGGWVLYVLDRRTVEKPGMLEKVHDHPRSSSKARLHKGVHSDVHRILCNTACLNEDILVAKCGVFRRFLRGGASCLLNKVLELLIFPSRYSQPYGSPWKIEAASLLCHRWCYAIHLVNEHFGPLQANVGLLGTGLRTSSTRFSSCRRSHSPQSPRISGVSQDENTSPAFLHETSSRIAATASCWYLQPSHGPQ